MENETLIKFGPDGFQIVDLQTLEISLVSDKYDLIMFDVDNKEKSAGRSCPPEAFVKPEFLVKVKSILQSTGKYLDVFINANPLLFG